MVILGLTGSIAMGKSTVSNMFRRRNIPVYDADNSVHTLLNTGGAAVPAIAAAFPGVVRNGTVIHDVLARIVYGDETALQRLESIVHPLVYGEQHRFLAKHARRCASLVVLDVPLLFETGGDRHCDAVCVVSAPKRLQVYRLLKRPGMDRARIEAILARQISDAIKRRRADFVIRSGVGFAPMLRSIDCIVAALSHWRGRHWPPPPRLYKPSMSAKNVDVC